MLCKVNELYDPAVPELQSLLPARFFPDVLYTEPEVLLQLRELGLSALLDASSSQAHHLGESCSPNKSF